MARRSFNEGGLLFASDLSSPSQWKNFRQAFRLTNYRARSKFSFVSASEIIKELPKLSEAERRDVLNKLRELSQLDDESWDELLNDPKPRPKLEAFLRESAAEGESPLDLNRL